MKQVTGLVLVLVFSVVASMAQGIPTEQQGQRFRLVPTEVVQTKDMAGLVMAPWVCDGEGNLYVRRVEALERKLQSPIRKYSRTGDYKLSLKPTDGDPTFAGGSFFVTREGDVYWLAWRPGGKDTFVLHFDKAGSYVSKAHLPRDIYPDGPLAVFPSGEILVAGVEGDENSEKPYTGIFESSGKLIRRINLADDAQIKDALERGDAAFTSPTGGGNLAVSYGHIAMAEDGNAYLLRRMQPAIVYAINPRGEVLRRFTVDGGDLYPAEIGESKGQLAILFRNFGDSESLLKVVNVQDGAEIATYDVDKKMGWALMCFVPPRFTFLTSESNRQTSFTHMEPQQ